MSRKPRLLVLAPRYPYPLVSGDRVRLVYICKELANDFEITLLCLCDDPRELLAPVPVDAPFANVERVWLSKVRSAFVVLRALFSATPLQVAYYLSRRFAHRARELAETHDLVLAHLIRTADYATAIDKPRVLEMTDALSLTYERASTAGSWLRLRTWIYRIERARVRRYERELLERFDAVVVVSEQDRDHLLAGAAHAPHVLVCSNGVDTTRFPFRPDFDDAPVVVFLGNLTTLPNLDACTYFAREILPSLRARRPWTFRAVGRIRPADARSLAAFEGVEVTGEVPDIATAVRGARAGVCPMRMGSGVQNKILEYMALGLPAITSSMSLRTIAAQPDHEILVADDCGAFVEHLERLFVDRDYGLRIATAGRNYVVRNHSWEAHLAPLVERVVSLVRNRT